MRAETLSFSFLILSSILLILGMGLFAAAQSQESLIMADGTEFSMVVREPFRWLQWPALATIAAGTVLAVVAVEPSTSRTAARTHFALFILTILALFVFLPAYLSIATFFTEPQTNDMRAWLSYGFLGPRGETPLGADATYDLLTYLFQFALVFTALLTCWRLFKPEECRSFFARLRPRLRSKKSASGGTSP